MAHATTTQDGTPLIIEFNPKQPYLILYTLPKDLSPAPTPEGIKAVIASEPIKSIERVRERPPIYGIPSHMIPEETPDYFESGYSTENGLFIVGRSDGKVGIVDLRNALSGDKGVKEDQKKPRINQVSANGAGNGGETAGPKKKKKSTGFFCC